VPRIAILSDVRLYREGLARILTEDGRLQVTAVSERAEDLLGSDRVEPDVVLLDFGTLQALAGARMIRDQLPRAKVVALGVREGRGEIISCAEAGVAAYVCRNGNVEDLVEAAIGATREELRCSRRIAAALFRTVATLASQLAPGVEGDSLSEREIQILRLIDDGLSNKEIASRLVIGVATVKNHVHSILTKLRAGSRQEAAAKVRAWRLRRLDISEPSMA
jgi:DNA-binding NarL/FixJ family response regulator